GAVRGAPPADGPPPGGVRPRGGAPAAGVDALRRRAPPGRDRAGALARADVSVARRALHRDRPEVGAGAPADDPLPPGAGARPRDHRPQRPRHAGYYRSRRDHPRRSHSVERQTWGAAEKRGGPAPVPRRGVPAVRLSLLDRLLSTEIGISFGFGLGFFSTLLVMNHVFYLARLAISQGMPFGGAPERQPVENVFFQAPSAEGTALYHARRYDPRTRTLESVTVIYLTGGETLRVIQAHEATYRAGGAWTFHDGEVYVVEQGHVVTTRFGAMDLNVPRSPRDLTLPPKPTAEMSLREL